MFTSNILFKTFKQKKKIPNLNKKLFSLLKNKNEVLKSLSKNYKDSFDKKLLHKYKKDKDYSILGFEQFGNPYSEISFSKHHQTNTWLP